MTLLVLVGSPARAFPGVLVAKDDAPRALRSTSVVLLRHQGISVVTLWVDYEGPLTPFALLVPVPADVDAGRVRTVRRATLHRVETVTAPRFHAFYEQDPCDSSDPEQSWEERIKARGPGFLASPGLPPLDRHYAVPNDISKAVAPVFKDAESEFRYQRLAFSGAEPLRTELTRRGYRITEAALANLAAELGAGGTLLVAEVLPERVELAGGARATLGGVRFWTRKPLTSFAESLASGSPTTEDVFVYVLDRQARFEVKNHENAFMPASLRVEPRVSEHLAGAYNALFDAVSGKQPDAFVAEYAWPTSGCGEPCPDVPLAPDELLTLGGGVLEAETTSNKERAPAPPDEPILERERFEEHLLELMPKERPAAVREHRAERRELERRRALTARQTYVLTRLHHRYPASAPRRSLELGPAGAVAGGVGVPKGAQGELSQAVLPAGENRYEVRFFALAGWSRGVDCAEPRRFRWGKRWASEARVSRAVPLALDLPNAAREPRVLLDALLRPLPELGLTPTPAAATAPDGSVTGASPSGSGASGSAKSAASGGNAPGGSGAASKRGCSAVRGDVPPRAVALWLVLLAALWLRRGHVTRHAARRSARGRT